MTSVQVQFSGVGIGMLLSASNGEQVSATIPGGCVLRVSYGSEWSDVAYNAPFTHDGEPASYRIDCVEYAAPVTATLTIGAA